MDLNNFVTTNFHFTALIQTGRGTPFRKFLNELIVAALPYGLHIQLPIIFATHHGTKIMEYPSAYICPNCLCYISGLSESFEVES